MQRRYDIQVTIVYLPQVFPGNVYRGIRKGGWTAWRVVTRLTPPGFEPSPDNHYTTEAATRPKIVLSCKNLPYIIIIT